MNLRNFTTSALALGLAIPMAGCFETIAGPYEGPAVVEFEQSPSDGGAYAFSECEGETITPTVNLIGEQRSSDLTLNFEVLSTSSASSDQYSFPEGMSVTIPAGSSSASFPIQLADDDADDDDILTLNIQLTSTSDAEVEPAENFKTINISIRDNEDDPDRDANDGDITCTND